MTKEMRPAHRVDVLAHALLYYAFTTKKKTTYVLKIILCSVFNGRSL